jgi:hypothetical protein
MKGNDRQRGQAAQGLEARKELIFPAWWRWR